MKAFLKNKIGSVCTAHPVSIRRFECVCDPIEIQCVILNKVISGESKEVVQHSTGEIKKILDSD